MSVNTLLLRFSAPLQSWGDYSRFTRRDTRREPTKSGVVGLVAAALGRRREDDVQDIAALEFGVRIDRQGTLLRDFHTAKNDSQAFISERYYLSDALFLVGLSGDAHLLSQIDAAIQSPVFPLFLGRRSCPPAGQVSLGVRSMELLETLEKEPWLGQGTPPSSLEIVHDAAEGVATHDHPLSFSQVKRSYGIRYSNRKNMHTQHDAMGALSEEEA